MKSIPTTEWAHSALRITAARCSTTMTTVSEVAVVLLLKELGGVDVDEAKAKFAVLVEQIPGGEQ